MRSRGVAARNGERQNGSRRRVDSGDSACHRTNHGGAIGGVGQRIDHFKERARVRLPFGQTRHAVILVSDLDKNELTQLAGIVSLPLVERLADVAQDRTETVAWFLAGPAQKLERDFHRRADLTSLLTKRLPQR
jgi:hypothetical protein